MPGVHIQERFLNATGIFSAPATGSNWTTSGSTGYVNPCGLFTDNIGLGIPNGLTAPVVSPASPVLAFDHLYYAGVIDWVANTNTTGILVGTFADKIWTNATSHTSTP